MSARSSPPPDRRSPWGRLAIAAGMVGVAAAAWLVWGRPQWRAYDHWRAARIAVDDREFGVARNHLERCQDAWPDDPQTHLELARVLRRGGQTDRAAAALTRAESLGHPRGEVELERALGRTQVGDARAIEAVPATSLTADNEWLVREALAAGYLGRHLLDRAYRVTTKWVADRPDDWQGHLWHARVLEDGLQYDLAIESYERATRLRPGRAEVERGLGEVLLRLGRFADARAHFEAALQSAPADQAARLGLARCQQALDPPAVAAATLRPLTEADSPPAAVCLLAGQLSLDLDQTDEAATYLRRAVAAAPHDRLANQALAQALYRLDRADEAKGYEDKAEAIGRDHKRMEQIIKEVAGNTGAADLRCEAGVILARLGQDGDAVRWLLGALAVDPGYKPAREALAEVAGRLGDPALADYARKVLAGPVPRR